MMHESIGCGESRRGEGSHPKEEGIAALLPPHSVFLLVAEHSAETIVTVLAK